MPVTHGEPTITINHDHQFMVSDPNATMVPTGAFGFFARDTRFVSGYSVTINGRIPLLLDASTIDHFSVRHEFTTPELPLAGTRNGAEHDIVLEERSIGFRLDRTIFEGIHEDYDLVSYAPHPVRLILEVAIESDFADISTFGESGSSAAATCRAPGMKRRASCGLPTRTALLSGSSTSVSSEKAPTRSSPTAGCSSSSTSRPSRVGTPASSGCR